MASDDAFLEVIRFDGTDVERAALCRKHLVTYTEDLTNVFFAVLNSRVAELGNLIFDCVQHTLLHLDDALKKKGVVLPHDFFAQTNDCLVTEIKERVALLSVSATVRNLTDEEKEAEA